MFSGIISDMGTVTSAESIGEGKRLTIACNYKDSDLALGASVACSGVCLTVTDIQKGDRTQFSVDLSKETLRVTPLGSLAVGDSLNLELSLRLGDSIDGHFVFGHGDGIATVVAITPAGDMQEMEFSTDKELLKLIAKKGSLAIDGVSLTVNKVTDSGFAVMVIPYTLQHTTLGDRDVGDKCTLEIDMLMRYVARLHEDKAA